MIDTAQLSPWLFLVAPIAIVVGYTIFGVSGFGSTAVTVPILAHFLPVAYLIPLMALLDLVSASVVGTTGRQHVSKVELKRLIPFMIVGIVVGVTLLANVPDRFLRIALGVFSTGIGVYSIVNPVMSSTISRLWAIPTGLVGGVLSAIFGAAGPLYATYISGRLRDKQEVRATVSTLISISALTRATIYALSGLMLHLAILAGSVVLAPFVWAGLRIGTRIHTGLTHVQLRRVVGALLIVIGSSLLVRVFE